MPNDSSHSKPARPDYSKGFPEGLEVFETLPDPRSGPATRHYFGELIFIAIASMLCGMDTCADFARFAESRKSWLQQWLKLPGGAPCANTFLRLFAAIDPEHFYHCLRDFVLKQLPHLEGKLINIDGKTLRGSRKDDGTMIQMVSAWIAQEGLTIAQQAVDKKSNEITAVPLLLRQLDLKGAVVSLDAMSTQRSIAKEIKDADADYLLALKGNQETIHQTVIEAFEQLASIDENEKSTKKMSTHTTVNKGHGRIEKRTATVIDSSEWLKEELSSKWQGLRSLVRIESETLMGKGKIRGEARYYLSSLEPNAKKQLEYTRAHWSIENQCHWVLDVVFDEDGCRARSGNAASNLSTLRRIVLNILKLDQRKPKEAIRGKRIHAVLDSSYLEHLMGIS